MPNPVENEITAYPIPTAPHLYYAHLRREPNHKINTLSAAGGSVMLVRGAC